MSDWDKTVAERKVEFSIREIYKLIRELPLQTQTEIIIEILCNEDYLINHKVAKWLSENEDILNK